MQHTTTIEINGIATKVVIWYNNIFGKITILSMQDLDGNEIAPDLLFETDNSVLMYELEDAS